MFYVPLFLEYRSIFPHDSVVTAIKKNLFISLLSLLRANLEYFGDHSEKVLMKFCTDFLNVTMIVTELFLALFSPLLTIILGYFWTHFGVCVSFRTV